MSEEKKQTVLNKTLKNVFLLTLLRITLIRYSDDLFITTERLELQSSFSREESHSYCSVATID